MVTLLARWRLARPPATRSGVDRAHRFTAILLALQRLSYLAPTVLSTASPRFHYPALNVALVVATVAWNGWLFWRVRRQGWFPAGLVWLDVGWTAALIVIVSANSGSSYEHSSVNWSGRMGQAAAALAGAAIDRIGLAALAVLLLLGAHTVATATGLAGSSQLVPELVSCLNGLLWFAVVIGFVVRYLRRQGSLLDQLTEDRVAAQAAQARTSARLAHYRALHDTVLSTLAAIARGGLDHRSEQVRQRCAREADYVRRLMLADDAGPPGSLGDRLGRVVDDVAALGLRVHLRIEAPDGAPDGAPEEVVEAFAGATREALNNVARHAGTGTAWVTADGTGGTVVVRVVDRGAGFRTGPTGTGPGGFGLPWSVVDRMRAVGGAARVASAPGEGTCVELVWPA